MSGVYLPPNNSSGNSSNSSGSFFLVVEQTELSHEWIITSPYPYAEPIIKVTQIGETTLDKPMVVGTFWEHLNPYKISIKFDKYPCKGHVILK
jgi:hypothetical protein